MAENTGGSTHAQRRKAKQIKSLWTDRIVSGSHALPDLIAAAQGNTKDAHYLASILLVDLLAAVHPGLSRGQIISELEPLPIKQPADPARFSIRSIRSRPELVESVEAMLRASAMTKTARARTEVPTEWPWGTKLSTLIRINGGEMPQGLDFLETGQGEVDPGDLLLAAPDAVSPGFVVPEEESADVNSSSSGISDIANSKEEALVEPPGNEGSGIEANVDSAEEREGPAPGDTLEAAPEGAGDAVEAESIEDPDDYDPLAALEADLGLSDEPEGDSGEHRSSPEGADDGNAVASGEAATDDDLDPIDLAFSDILGQEAT